MPILKARKTRPDAAIPSKSRETDVGYDLTALDVVDRFAGNRGLLCDTGIQVQLDSPDWYLEIVPRSSLPIKGFSLGNSVGIIDPEYTGNLLVTLVKIDPTAPDPVFPFKCCQLVLRRRHAFGSVVEASEPFDETSRGSGGFGSTDA